MGLMDKLKGELVDIIEWIDDSRSTLAWRFPRYQNEIKNGAQLIVREGQKAVFVYRGALADQFDPGSYELKSENLPILSTLQGWKHGFNSPFRSEVYFINTRPVTDLRCTIVSPRGFGDANTPHSDASSATPTICQLEPPSNSCSGPLRGTKVEGNLRSLFGSSTQSGATSSRVRPDVWIVTSRARRVDVRRSSSNS